MNGNVGAFALVSPIDGAEEVAVVVGEDGGESEKRASIDFSLADGEESTSVSSEASLSASTDTRGSSFNSCSLSCWRTFELSSIITSMHADSILGEEDVRWRFLARVRGVGVVIVGKGAIGEEGLGDSSDD